MMTTTSSPTVSPAARPSTSSLVPAAQVVVFGHLVWLGLVWLASVVVYAAVVAGVARWGSVDESLWQSVVSGWQRYVIFGAGITIMTTFLRMLVRNGATRRTVSGAATIAMGVIAALVALLNVAGFAVERLVYDANGWTQGLRSDAELAWADLPPSPSTTPSSSLRIRRRLDRRHVLLPLGRRRRVAAVAAGARAGGADGARRQPRLRRDRRRCDGIVGGTARGRRDARLGGALLAATLGWPAG